MARGLTVRDVEDLSKSARQTSGVGQQKLPETDPDTKSLQERIALSIGADVEIRSTGKMRELRIKVHDLDQLTYICEKFLGI